MDKFTNGRACRLLSCPFADLKQCEAIYANCLVLIVLYRVDETQSWQGFAGDDGIQKSAVIYNIYPSLRVSIPVFLQSGCSEMVNGHV